MKYRVSERTMLSGKHFFVPQFELDGWHDMTDWEGNPLQLIPQRAAEQYIEDQIIASEIVVKEYGD